MGFPDGSVAKNLPIKQEMWFCPWVGKIPWRRKWQPHPVFFLPGKSYGQRSLEGYSPWGCKETGITWRLNNSNMVNPRWVNKMVASLCKKCYDYITKHTFQLILISENHWRKEKAVRWSLDKVEWLETGDGYKWGIHINFHVIGSDGHFCHWLRGEIFGSAVLLLEWKSTVLISFY